MSGRSCKHTLRDFENFESQYPCGLCELKKLRTTIASDCAKIGELEAEVERLKLATGTGIVNENQALRLDNTTLTAEPSEAKGLLERCRSERQAYEQMAADWAKEGTDIYIPMMKLKRVYLESQNEWFVPENEATRIFAEALRNYQAKAFLAKKEDL